MKEKPNSTRTYDADGFRRRAACLCVRGDEESEILLVSSSGSPDRFIVPGGGLEPNEDASTAALREVMEEGGVKGQLGRCLGIFENSERRHRTQVFVLKVEELLEEWDDSKSIGRKRKWFSIDGALTELTISKPVQCNYVRLLIKNKLPSNDDPSSRYSGGEGRGGGGDHDPDIRVPLVSEITGQIIDTTSSRTFNSSLDSTTSSPVSSTTSGSTTAGVTLDTSSNSNTTNPNPTTTPSPNVKDSDNSSLPTNTNAIGSH